MSRSICCVLVSLAVLQFRGTLDVALVHVTVVDSGGIPVAGLGPADFEATIAKRQSSVLAVEYLVLEQPQAASPPGAAEAVTPTQRPNVRRRTFLFLFDDLSFKPAPARQIAQAFEDLLSFLGPQEPVGLANSSGLGEDIQPTTDRAVLTAGLRKLQGRREDVTAPFIIGIDEAFGIETRSAGATLVARECEILRAGPGCGTAVLAAARREGVHAVHRTEQQIRKMRAAIAAMGGLPEPRVLILISAGIASDPRHGLGDYARELSEAAASSNVQIYALTVAADGADASDLTPERRSMRVSERQFLARGLQTMAHAAGGESFVMIGQPRRFVQRIALETSALYQIALEVPALVGRQQKFLDVKVKVRRRGVTVRSRPLTVRKGQ